MNAHLTRVRSAPKKRVGRLIRWILIVAPIFPGCSEPPTPVRSDDSADAKQELQTIFAHYQECQAYSDQATIALRYQQGSQRTVDNARIETRFVRPNQIDMKIMRGVNSLQLHSDGEILWTQIIDPTTHNLDGQVIQMPAPAVLTPTEIYAATELVNPALPNEAMSALFGMPLNLEISQLGLLLRGELFPQLAKNGTVVRLADESLKKVTCQRYQLSHPTGSYIFWWSPQQKALRRIEYPPELLFGQIPESERPEECTFNLDINDVQFGDSVKTVFDRRPPAGSELVRFFVLPPVKLPSDLLGDTIPRFPLKTLEDQPFDNQRWSDKTLILCWFQNHPTSRATLPRIQRAKNDLARLSDKLAFAAICADNTTTVSDAQLQKLADQLKLEIPVLRDPSAAGRDLLKIQDAPTVVILDQERRLQFFEVGANPNIRESLVRAIERIMTGQNIGLELKQRIAQEQQAYERQLVLARLSSEPNGLTASELPAASLPQKLKLHELWQSSELSSPGNSVVVRSGEGVKRISVLNGTHEIVQLDSEGKVQTRVQLPLSDSAGITRLRTAVNAEGKHYYAGFSQLGQQLHLLDEQFQVAFSYPKTAESKLKILDVELLDIDQNGQLELLVGFADPAGIHCVDLSGNRLWSNRATPSVTSIAPRYLAKPPYLLITSDRGTLRSVSRAGEEGPSITIPNRTIHQLKANRSKTQRPTQFLGISLTVDGRLIAVGLSAGLQESWSYGLPSGFYRSQVETVQSSQLFEGDENQWLLVGPDGSIHLIGDDGDFFDFFRTGESVDGLSAYRDGTRGTLIISTAQGIRAYAVER